MPPHVATPYTGRIVVRLAPALVKAITQWVEDNGGDLSTLGEVATELHVSTLQSLVAQYSQVPSQRAVTNISTQALLALEENARDGPLPPRHSLAGYYIVDPRGVLSPPEVDQLLADFRENTAFELVYPEPAVRDATVTPEDERAYPRSYRGHFDGGYLGIHARSPNVWGVCDGSGVGLVDLEAGWNLNHEDLPKAHPPVYNLNRPPGGHGTSVLGLIVGRDNGIGIVGIAPGANVLKLVSHIKPAGALYPLLDEWDVAGAIIDALTPGLMKPGDVLLIEVETLGPDPIVGYPVETVALWFDAIRLAAGSRIVVVEAAGNGDSLGVGRNLDVWQDPLTGRRLRRTVAEDSGAVLVSACASAIAPLAAHLRLAFANYGSRIDCYAWGENVYTAGGGDLTPSINDPNRWYTKQFGGTSAASAIVAGAAILLQCLGFRQRENRFTPSQVRKLLSKASTGTAVLTPAGGERIGTMPDLDKILATIPATVPTAGVG